MKRILITTILTLLLSTTARAKVYSDEMGGFAHVTSTPGRIVSLSPATTEILFALGLHNEIVGVSGSSAYPGGVKNKPQIANYADLKKIASLTPDLVLTDVNGASKEVIRQLRERGLSVFVINPRNVTDIFKSVLAIGDMTETLNQAGKLVVKMQRRMDKINRLTATQEKLRVFAQTKSNPLTSVGKNTIFDHLISLAGGKNIAHDSPTKYPRYSAEEVVLKRPQVIIISTLKGQDAQKEIFGQWAEQETIPAVKNKRIYTIDPDLVTIPGPRVIEGLEELARLLHPEVFELP